MSAPNLTPWFTNGELPAREGVYEVFWCYRPVFARFTRRGWMHGADRDKNIAAEVRDLAYKAPKKWRGLAAKP